MDECSIPGCKRFTICQVRDPNQCGLAVPCLCNGSGIRCIADKLNVSLEECPISETVRACPEDCRFNATCLICNGKGWLLTSDGWKWDGMKTEW